MRAFSLILFLRRATRITLPLIFGISSWMDTYAHGSFDTPKQLQQEDTNRVTTLLRLFEDNVTKDVTSAREYAEEALALSEKLKYAKGLGDSKRALGDVHRLEGDFDEAEILITEAIAISEQHNDDISLAKGYLALYKLYFVRGDYTRSAETNQKALAIAERSQRKDMLAEAYGNEAISAGIGGEHLRAVELFLKSLDMYRAIGDMQMEGVALMRIGHTFELAGSYEKALDYLFQSLEINRELGSWGYTGWCLLNIGVTKGRIAPEDYAGKRDYYLQALEMAEKAKDFRLKLACLDNIGGSWSLEGNYAMANRYLNQAYKLSTSAGHNSRTVFIAGNLAENYLYTGQLDSAIFFGTENLSIARQENNTFEKRQAYSVLSQIYAQREEHKKAYDMLLEHTRLSDSIFNVQKSQQIEDLREKYETDRKEQEIDMLTKDKAAAVFRRNSFALLSVLFLIVGSLVFAVLKLREKKNKLLLQKEIELDRMKSRFFANISHEFRTPLTLILGPIDEMMARSENGGLDKYLRPMRRNANRLLELVNQLLELSRIESGKLKPVLTRSNIAPLVKGIVMSFDSLAEMKRIKLEVAADNIPEAIFLDTDKFEKILSNLLSNAFKFTPEEGSIRVVVQKSRSCRLPDVNECLEVALQDSGRGIASEEVAHIFDRFYQADNNQLLQQDGSGIGLALTRELVELHLGTIWADSDISSGTQITLQLPLDLEERMKGCVAGAVPSGTTYAIPIKREDGTGQDEDPAVDIASSRSEILLIEDHDDVRRYIHDVLAEHFTVIEASNGKEGVAKALERIPDLIVSDVMMPGMDGHEVCSILKMEEKTSHIPIVMLTAKADIANRIEGLESKADDYITKPFVPKELLTRIRNLIESRRLLQEKYNRTVILKPDDIEVHSADEKFLRKLMSVLEVHMGDERFGVETLGLALGMSRSQLHRKLKALTGKGPSQFMRSFRLTRARDLLKAKTATTAEIAYTVGFGSPSYFTKCFHEEFGYTPSEVVDH